MTTKRLPSLLALRSFEATARLGSMKSAANELCVTPGAISQLIRKLEEELSTTLFIRKNRQIILTSKGRLLWKDAHNAFSVLRTAIDKLSSLTKNRLSIACDRNINRYWLSPRLAQLLMLLPNTSVTIHPFSEAAELDWCDYDFCLTSSPLQHDKYCRRKLSYETYTVVASPSYVLGNTDSITAEKLHNLRFLVAQNTKFETAPSWKEWLNVAKLNPSKPIHTLDVGGDFEVAINAVRSGAGLALVPSLMVTSDIQKGELVVPFSSRIKSKNSYWLNMSECSSKHPELKQVSQWIIDEFKSSGHLTAYTNQPHSIDEIGSRTRLVQNSTSNNAHFKHHVKKSVFIH